MDPVIGTHDISGGTKVGFSFGLKKMTAVGGPPILRSVYGGYSIQT